MAINESIGMPMKYAFVNEKPLILFTISEEK